MKLQLLPLVTIVTIATAVPALKTADLHEKRQVTQCTKATFGKRCQVINVCSNQIISQPLSYLTRLLMF